MDSKDNKVVIAMSGGVDSSLAARLLVDQGYDVMGVTMKLWGYIDSEGRPTHDSNCCSLDDINNAKAECASLGIPHYTLDMSAEFKEIVIQNFVSEYKAGRTPNPCIICNTEIKWHALLNKLDDLGVQYLATGHYARKVKHDASGKWVVGRGKDQGSNSRAWERSGGGRGRYAGRRCLAAEWDVGGICQTAVREGVAGRISQTRLDKMPAGYARRRSELLAGYAWQCDAAPYVSS